MSVPSAAALSIAAAPSAQPSLGRRIGGRAAWCVWLLTLVQVVVLVVLAVGNDVGLRGFFANYVVASVLAALSFATVGALIVARGRDGSPAIGWLFCAAGFGFGTGWMGEYARHALVVAPGSLPAAEWPQWLNSFLFPVFLAAIAVYLPLVYPTGRWLSPRWRPVAGLGTLALVLQTFTLAISPGPVDTSVAQVANPFAPPWASQVIDLLTPVNIVLVLASLASGAVAVVVRFRRASGVQRQQIKWFAFGLGVTLAALLLPIVLLLPRPLEDSLLSGIFLCLGFPAIPVATGVAILRYRLFDIDRLISHATVYALLTACVIGVYVFVVGYLGVLFHTADNLVVSLVGVGLVAVLFQPLREQLQRLVNRVTYGERDDPYRVLARLGQRLEATAAADDVLDTVVSTVRTALNLPYAALAVERGYAVDRVAESGARPACVERVPLVHQGETVGELVVSQRDPGEPFTDADRALLSTLGHQAGAAVHALQLHGELRQARERLVLAREEERRRLRHDLHDQLAPTLAALSITSARAADRLATDPDTARALLSELQQSLRASIADVRRLAYDLRPPVLDELGLLAAIEERAQQFTSDAGLQISVHAPTALAALPAAVEVAAYRIVLEAVMNVSRHAQARQCLVELTTTADTLQVRVSDDGGGLPDGFRAGVGLASMRERASELGGECTIEGRDPHGTIVTAILPLTDA